MADPVTLLTVASAGLSIFGTISKLGGQKVESQGQQVVYESQARAAEYNAEIGQKNAAIQQTQTAADVERTRRENYVRAGASRAAAGALGGLTGSSLDVLASNAAEMELDVLNIKQQGALREAALLEGATLDIFEAQSARQGASIAKKTAKYSTASTILGGVSNVASSFM